MERPRERRRGRRRQRAEKIFFYLCAIRETLFKCTTAYKSTRVLWQNPRIVRSSLKKSKEVGRGKCLSVFVSLICVGNRDKPCTFHEIADMIIS